MSSAVDFERRLIPGRGPVPADGMFVGEAGGQTEHFRQRPFCGKTGDVLTAYCQAAGVARSDTFITNTYPFWTGQGNPDPTPEQIKAEEWRLIADIKRVRPRVIGAVGRIAARWFLGDVDMDTVHGIPYFSDKAPGAIIVPIYHPAAGFYDPDFAAYSQEDVMKFAYYLANPVSARTPPRYTYKLWKKPPAEIRGAVDTEGLEDAPWGLSWCEDGVTCNVYIWKKEHKPPKLSGFIEFHNALHDLKILRAMGIETRGVAYGDTMVRLFNLQLEPQSLKAAAYRHLSLKMHEFDEVVRPHFNALAVRFLERAAAGEYPKPEPIAVADYAKKKDRLYKPQGVGRRIKNLLKSWEKDQASIAAGILPDKPVRLENRWSKIGESQWVDQTEEYQQQAEDAVGETFPSFSIFCVPTDQATTYSGTDAGATALLVPKLDELIEQKQLRRVYEMDRRALPFVDRCQEVGMRVDKKKLHEFEIELRDMRERARRRVQSVVNNRWFNPGSAEQVAKWLYVMKGLEALTFTDSGRGSTKDSALKMLRGYNKEDPDVVEFLDALKEYRESDKYLGTFVEPIFGYMRRDRDGYWRVHPNFRVTRVVSGRLSSFDPNVLALPARTKLGRRIRGCFIAREGYILVDCDASQVELRMMAHHCRDPRMVQAFENDEDLHSITTSIIFRIALEEVIKDSPERFVAKTINFAVMYGITARALLEQLYKAEIFHFTLEDCEKFIREWFKVYGSVLIFLQKLWREATKLGHVRDMWGRLCYIPNLRVIDNKLLEAAKRLCGNFPIQGGAHGLVKRAEVRVLDWIDSEGLSDHVQPWLQMHDELLIEARKDLEDDVKRFVSLAMVADQRKISVPLKADAKSGMSWLEAK